MCRITLHLHTAGIVNVEVNVPLDDMDGKRRTQRAVAKEAIEVKSVAALYEDHGGDSPWHKYALVSGRQSFVAFNEAEWKALKKDDTIYLSGEVHVCVWVCMCECACVCVCVCTCVCLCIRVQHCVCPLVLMEIDLIHGKKGQNVSTLRVDPHEFISKDIDDLEGDVEGQKYAGIQVGKEDFFEKKLTWLEALTDYDGTSVSLFSVSACLCL